MMLPLAAFFTGGGQKDVESITIKHQPSGSTGYTGFIASGTTGGPIGDSSDELGEGVFTNLQARSGEVGNGVVTEKDFVISTNKTTTQDDFRYVIVQAKNNTVRVYQSSDAIFATGGGVSVWSWGDGSDVVWDSGEDTLVKDLIFVR